MIKQFSNLEKALLCFAALCGSLILFCPIQYLVFVLIAILLLVYLLLNPKICFFLTIVASTWVYALPLSQQVPFNQTDILITICFIGTLLRYAFIDRFKINIRTKIDVWLIALFILYFFAGFTSISHRGYQGFLRFGEIIATFYMTVYFLRTKTISMSQMIKLILFIGLIQASLGIFQSITGVGTNFQDNRGYLGYLGLGSSLVWHGKGTFEHFNSLGPFLCIVFLFFLPINYFVAKNKRNGYICLLILFFGIITTYSRGSLIALIVSLLFFVYVIQKNKKIFLLKLTPFALLATGAWGLLKNTSYISTISSRDEIWTLVITAITSSKRSLFFGTGLNSYENAVWPYIPANIAPKYYILYAVHNFFLGFIVEVGILGLIIILSFLFYIMVSSYKNIKCNNILNKSLNLSICLVIISIFSEGMFDYAFNSFVFQLWLFFFLGILYSKCKLEKRN